MRDKIKLFLNIKHMIYYMDLSLKLYKILQKYFYKKKNFKELLTCKTEEELYITFQKIWKNTHGGLFRIDEPWNPPEFLPYYKNNKIIVTDVGSSSIKFHKEYIKTLNNLIIENSNNDIINLDFTNNGGGKPEVMVAGLLPIFNNFDLKVLSYFYDRNMEKHYDVKRIENKIISISNNKAESIGTSRKVNVKEINIYFNNFTISAAEGTIICLLSLSEYIKINLFGEKTGGYTSVNKYFKLSDKYGLEIPIGYMGTNYKIYKNGI
jgi:hypothetical protein